MPRPGARDARHDRVCTVGGMTRVHGGGTGLVRDALTAIPAGQLVLAGVAPGNAASVRAPLSAGFIRSAPSSRSAGRS